MAVKKVIEIDVDVLNAQGGLDKFVDTLKETEQQSVSLKSELRKLKEQLATLPEGTAEYDKIAKRAGEVSDQIGDINTKVKNLGSDTKGIDAIVQGAQTLSGAFSVASSASALLGDENEDLQKTMLKVESAIGLTVGIQSIANALQKESALVLGAQSLATTIQTGLQYAYTTAVGTTTGALKLLKIALISTGIGAIVVLLGSLISALADSTEATEEQKKAQDNLNKSLEQTNEYYKSNLDGLKKVTEERILRAKIAGKGEKELLNIEKDSREERRKLYEQEKNELYKKLDDKNVDLETSKKINKQLSDNQKQYLNDLDEYRKQDLERQLETAEKIRENDKKRAEENKKLSKERQEEAERQRKLDYEKRIKENQDYWDKYFQILNGVRERETAEYEAKKAFDQLDAENTQFLADSKLAKLKETADKELEIEKNKLEQKKAIQNAELQLLDNFVGFFKEIAGKNKGLQKAAIIAESALGIAKMVIANNTANAGALATPQAILTSGASAVPVIARNNISTAFGIGASIVATAKALSSLGGGGAPSAGSTQGGGASGGASSAPQFNVVGNAGVNQIASTLNKEQPPLQAYVVGNKVTTQQALDRNIVDNASL